MREKPHRLPRESYRGRVVVAITACVHGGQPLFADPEVVAVFRTQLEGAAAKHGCVVPVYCFMPDHLHVILAGRDAASDTYAAMVEFKQRTGFWLGQNRPAVRWQKDFYDHIIRADENWIAQVRYVADNPVRRGLCRAWDEYPHTGAIGVDLRRLLVEMAIDEATTRRP